MNNAFTPRFLESIKDHQLTIIENSEHAKIFRFARPDTVALSCTIAYVADTCLITGDMGHYLFGRLLNPYAFFLRNQSVFSLDYTKEKVLARDTSGPIDVYDGEVAKQNIRQIIIDERADCDDEDELEMWDELTERLEFVDFDDESEVKEWLDDARSSFNSAFDEIDTSNFTTLSDNFICCVQAVVYATRLFEQESKMEKQNNGWISVEERLPPIEQTVLLYVLEENTRFIISGWLYINDDGEHHFASGEENLTTTHWQPLPEPPTP